MFHTDYVCDARPISTFSVSQGHYPWTPLNSLVAIEADFFSALVLPFHRGGEDFLMVLPMFDPV